MTRGSSPRSDAAPSVAGGVVRVGLGLTLIFASLGLGIGYWQVWRAQALTTAPDDPLVIAAARSAPRGRIVDAHGVVLAESVRAANGEMRRAYHAPAAAVVVGYASPIFGTSGLERVYDPVLTGLTGSTASDDLLRKFRRQGSTPGSLHLTIDLRLQQRAVDLLGADRGAVVALDPSTGAVLALASTPGFDPARVVDPSAGPDYFESLRADPAAPLLDRATQGLYVPGSVFKLVTALAALDARVIDAETTYPEQPAEERSGFLVSGFRVRDGHHAFTGDRILDFASAVEVSCNIYFARTALRLGGAALRDWADRAGFDAALPFDLPSAASQVTGGAGPGGGFRDDVELANAGYGQAETLVTPLQMALVTAGVANGGVLMRPQLITAIEADGTLRTQRPETWRRVSRAGDVALLRDAMQRAVEGQWGRLFAGAAKVPGVPTAGKSGTAELGGNGEPHSWFVGFAPVDSPRIVVAVIVENGGRGAQRAVPMGGQLMAYYLGLQP